MDLLSSFNTNKCFSWRKWTTGLISLIYTCNIIALVVNDILISVLTVGTSVYLHPEIFTINIKRILCRYSSCIYLTIIRTDEWNRKYSVQYRAKSAHASPDLLTESIYQWCFFLSSSGFHNILYVVVNMSNISVMSLSH